MGLVVPFCCKGGGVDIGLFGLFGLFRIIRVVLLKRTKITKRTKVTNINNKTIIYRRGKKTTYTSSPTITVSQSNTLLLSIISPMPLPNGRRLLKMPISHNHDLLLSPCVYEERIGVDIGYGRWGMVVG